MTIGGSSGKTVFNNSGKHHLCAEEFVLLDKNSEISGTAEVTLSCRPYQHDQWHGIHPDSTGYNEDVINKLISTKLLDK